MAKQQGAVQQPVAEAQPQTVAPAPGDTAPVPVANVPQMTPADAEFSSLMGTFKLFVILSILFDVFFIFLILSFIKKGELKGKSAYVSPVLQSEFNTWSKVFIIGLVVRIVLFFGCICLNVVGTLAFLPFVSMD